MQSQSHASQNMGEPSGLTRRLDSQAAIRSPNGRTRTVGRFEDDNIRCGPLRPTSRRSSSS